MASLGQGEIVYQSEGYALALVDDEDNTTHTGKCTTIADISSLAACRRATYTTVLNNNTHWFVLLRSSWREEGYSCRDHEPMQSDIDFDMFMNVLVLEDS